MIISIMTSTIKVKNMFNILSDSDEHLGTSSQPDTPRIRFNKNLGVKYSISTSYKGSNKDDLPGHATLFVPNERTKGFHKLADKESVHMSLQGTKACRNVIRNDGQKDFGICMRDKCTFAHSLSEFKLPPCAFGDNCNRKFGTKDKSGKIDKNNKCVFSHPRETIEQYYTRTGVSKPDLPETSEKTRHIDNIKIEPNVEKIELVQGQLQEHTQKGSWKKPLQIENKKMQTTQLKVPKEHAQKFIDLLLELELYDHEVDTF